MADTAKVKRRVVNPTIYQTRAYKRNNLLRRIKGNTANVRNIVIQTERYISSSDQYVIKQSLDWIDNLLCNAVKRQFPTKKELEL